MYKLFQVSIFSLMILIAGENTVSASESDWDTYTTTDKLTGKKNYPFLSYRIKISNTSEGIFNLRVSCESESPFTGGYMGDHLRVVRHSLTIHNAPLLKLQFVGLGTNGLIRQLSQDDKVIEKVYSPTQYKNYYQNDVVSVQVYPNYSNFPKKQEFNFEDGNSIIVEFGRKYLNYVTSCFAGRECANKSICGPAK